LNYIELATKTESQPTPEMNHRMEHNTRLLHAAFGLCTEAGEFLDALKRHIFYNTPFDETNAQEELGDIMWYMAIACDVLNISFEQVQEQNIAKLKTRYPDKFNEDKAANRDLDKERAVLVRDVSTDGEPDYLFITSEHSINLNDVMNHLVAPLHTREVVIEAIKKGWCPTAEQIRKVYANL